MGPSFLEDMAQDIATRVVVTGLGCVTPLGRDVKETWRAVLAGRSGVDYIKGLASSSFGEAIAAEVCDWRPEDYLPRKRLRHMDRYAQFGAVASLEALDDAGLTSEFPLGPNAGVAFGSAFGGQGINELHTSVLQKSGPRGVSPFTLIGILPDSASGEIAILTGASGPNMAIISASATGAGNIGEAAEVIRRGDAELMIAGAAEAPLTAVLYAGFAAMRAMAVADTEPAKACRPFDLNRNGFVVAEGAGAVVLESLDHARRRNAKIYAELAGYACSNDGFDMVAVDPDGSGAVRAMATALRKAHLDPDSVGYINAHGSASRMNDRVETAAIKNVFGASDAPAVSSTKSMMGHLMGAAGAVEAVLSVLALCTKTLPPTINYTDPDPECDLDYVPNRPRRVNDLSVVLSNSFGLGGHNASLIFKSQ